MTAELTVRDVVPVEPFAFLADEHVRNMLPAASVRRSTVHRPMT
jgi:hypothetical protein